MRVKWLTAEQAKVVRFEINARRPPWDMPWEIQPGLHPVERAHMAEMYRHRQIKLAKTLALRQARQRAKDEVAALEISRGGYTRASLESIGVAWPPPKGWKKRHITRRVTEELVAINKPTKLGYRNIRVGSKRDQRERRQTGIKTERRSTGTPKLPRLQVSRSHDSTDVLP